MAELFPRIDISLTRAQAKYAKNGGNAFAFSLFKEVSKEAFGDMVISPLGILFDLGMVANGAAGNTKAEIEGALGYEEDSLGVLNSFCKTMMENATVIDSSTTIGITNSVVRNSLQPALLEDFKMEMESDYFADFFSMVFGVDDVVSFVNDWCKEKTHGLITEILADQPDKNDYVYFLNALYFKGIWSSPFKKRNTRREEFTTLSGTKKTVDMMSKVGHLNYGSTDLGSAVSLPFGNQAFQMIFILPEKGKSLDDLRGALDLDSWGKLLGAMYDTNVDVKIPSFETPFSVDLQESLQRLGVKDAFNPLYADFTKMTDHPVIIGKVLHKAYIKVDEQGSKAAAATAILMATTSPGPEQTVKFHADRPFIYAITEKSTGAIFFLGQYTGN